MSDPKSRSFHRYYDARVRAHQVFHPGKGWVVHELSKHTKTEDRRLTYEFRLHAHPYVTELVKNLVQGSVAGLEAANIEYKKGKDGRTEPLTDSSGKVQTLANGDAIPRPVLYDELFGKTIYGPTGLVGQPYPVKDLDFTSSGAYSVYNWELFYHLPMTMAINLSQNQRFQDAQHWFHYVFDPTDDSDGPTPERFWKVKPFQCTDVAKIEQVMVNLSAPADPTLQQDTINSIGAWKDNPFRPFLVARYRQTAFMFKTVMAYLDNLIAWGDSLFSQYTGETINEAQQLYILAANILGPKPQAVPGKSSIRPQTYANLRSHLDQFGNALVNMENEIPFDNAPHPNKAAPNQKVQGVSSIGKSLYFCVPRNDKLLQYWDTVADRLFKIRNSLNIQGIFQRVPLFEPPIDPALLARGAAEGLDVGAIISGLNQPLPLVRFQYLVQKAAEICQEVKSLGGNLLSAMEKYDNEALSLLRAQHETTLLKLGESVKYCALQEAKKNREGLEESIKNAAARFSYYEQQLGAKVSDIKIPKIDPIDDSSLKEMKFDASEPAVGLRQITVDIASGIAGDLGAGSIISSYEAAEIALLTVAETLNEAAAASDSVGSGLAIIPEVQANVEPMGTGGSIGFGGQELHNLFSAISDGIRGTASGVSFAATMSSKLGAYSRRQLDWTYQSNLAAGEMTQLFKQLRAAQIREAMAELDWKNHQVQIKQAQEIETFLEDKPTGQALYAWMKREVKGLYGKAFQFAFDIARKAERALQQELGDSSLSFIEYGYLAGKEGLLAGEKLYQDIKRMEFAYTELNKREYEMTKHVSLLQVDPLALLQLRSSGSCTVTLPEEIFDFDCPGQYFRRIRSVAVSIPCVVGPYTSINCRLTLLKSSIRTTTADGDGDNAYVRNGNDDPRFSDFFGSVQSIVTSSGQNDSGLFETNLHDERKLPFEWSGAVSQWQLDLPADIRQFDFDTIADVILHLRYTAREGGNALRSKAVKNLQDAIGNAQTLGSVRLFSMRHEFPSDWAKFKALQAVGTPPLVPLTITLRPEHYPFWSQGRAGAVQGVGVYAEAAKQVTVSFNADGSESVALGHNAPVPGLLSGALVGDSLPGATGPRSLYLSDNSMDELWLAITVAWQLPPSNSE